ncbi:MAG: RDD family protein [Caldilinea sp.]
MGQRNVGLMGQYAGFITRAVAIIIDILIVIVSVLVITASITLPLDFFLGINTQSCTITGGGPSLLRDWEGMRELLCGVVNFTSLLIAILTGPIYFIFLATAGGQTVGKYIMGVRVVRLDGKPMSYLGSTLRWFGYLASLLPLGLGFFWVVIDDQRRGFHDKLTGTCVVYAWRAQQSEFLVARIQRFLGRASKRGRVALMRVLATHHIELVMLAVPGFNELNNMLRIVQAGIQNGDLEVLGFQEYAKSSDGIVSHMDIDPMLDGIVNVVDFSEYAGFTAARILQIRDELPNDHFALAVLVDEKNADQLVKMVARRTSAQIRRYDSRDSGSSGVAHYVDQTVQTNATPALASVVSDAAVEAAPTSYAIVALDQIAHVAPAHGQAEPASPDPIAAINELKQQQTALQEALAAKNEALLRLEQQAQASDAGLDASSSDIYS